MHSMLEEVLELTVNDLSPIDPGVVTSKNSDAQQAESSSIQVTARMDEHKTEEQHSELEFNASEQSKKTASNMA